MNYTSINSTSQGGGDPKSQDWPKGGGCPIPPSQASGAAANTHSPSGAMVLCPRQPGPRVRAGAGPLRSHGRRETPPSPVSPESDEHRDTHASQWHR